MQLSVVADLPEEGGVIGLAARDGVLVLTLDPRASFELLRQGIRDTFSASPDRFRGMDARLDLGTRPIELLDLRRLVHVLREEFGITAMGLYCTAESVQRYAERELKLRLYTTRAPEPAPPPVAAPEDAPEPPVLAAAPAPEPVAEAPEAPPVPVLQAPAAEVDPGGSRVLSVDRAVRAGQRIDFHGDVQVFGDVHPGAEIVATGNILVLGALKGLVHAGAAGDESAIILAFEMRPIQLRIAGRIQVLEPRPARAGVHPELAWVDGEIISIGPYPGSRRV